MPLTRESTPSPGSIFAYLAETPRGSYFGVLLGIVVSAGVSLTVASALLGFGHNSDDLLDLDAAQAQSAANKQASKLTPVGATAAVEGI